MQIEKAGGHSSGDGQGISGLDIKVEKHDQVPRSLHSLHFHLFYHMGNTTCTVFESVFIHTAQHCKTLANFVTTMSSRIPACI